MPKFTPSGARTMVTKFRIGLVIALSFLGVGCTFVYGQDIPVNQEPPASLVVKPKSLTYNDTDGNGRLDAGETATIEWTLVNSGRGSAKGFRMLYEMEGTSQDITIITSPFPEIRPNESLPVIAIIKAGPNLQTGSVSIRLFAKQHDRTESESVEVIFPTLAFQPPGIVLAEGLFSAESQTLLKVNSIVNLELLVQNTGAGKAEEITALVTLPENVISIGKPQQPVIRLRPGESVRIKTTFMVTPAYTGTEIPIKVTVREKLGPYGTSHTFGLKLDQPLTRVTVSEPSLTSGTVIPASLPSDVDQDIPVSRVHPANRFALVIGNEDYRPQQPGVLWNQETTFARNDAYVFREYLLNTLGYPEKQTFLATDVNREQLNSEVARLVALVKLNKGSEIVFYYAGLGLTDPETHDGYIVPVGVGASNLKEGLRLSQLYFLLASSGASRITVFLEASFGGGKGELPKGNMIVFNASTDNEVSLPYATHYHGWFTYFVLHKLKETKGVITLKELSDYLEKEVPVTSPLESGQKQTPHLLLSPGITEKWKKWKL